MLAVVGILATIMVIAIIVCVALALLRLLSGDVTGAVFAGIVAFVLGILLNA